MSNDLVRLALVRLLQRVVFPGNILYSAVHLKRDSFCMIPKQTQKQLLVNKGSLASERRGWFGEVFQQ